MRFGTEEPGVDTGIYCNYRSISKELGVSNVCFASEVSRAYIHGVPFVISERSKKAEVQVDKWTQ